MSLPPLSLYVHLPWCVQKCPYCDFNSHTAGEAAPRQRYLDALLVDLEDEASRGEGRRLESIFLGGGTPSLFSPEEIGRLLEGIRACFDIADNAEITMEANPGTIECGKPAGYRDAGINRLSFGGQSFNDELLKKIGRIHNSEDIVRAVNDAQAAGVNNVNIDLMHGLPGQNVAVALEDLETAISLSPTHISWYQLTLEPNTVFYARPPGDLPDEKTTYTIQERGQALLAERGYRQYEVSAFARDDKVCAHNLNYWLFGDYLAAGAGAHGKISDALGVFRYQKPANPMQYMKTIEARGQSAAAVRVAGTELVFEFMLNALRLSDGFSDAIFCERTGLGADELEGVMREVCEKGLVARVDPSRWQATPLGRRFLNDLQAEFLPDKP
ncbi:MAG: radical SAM family heme chaperone HemW [Gammaproteobacteria bacterium]|nr:radical SAM family heme chaperone HemW [Gammaproteobacteria bacterium]MDH3491803.1 radical SAM family heme chaperone HemW [Gammaproteobacteria bacterium]MDH3578931.1 radical SAM family heme chaperone HemW [Gammaproteobacteria bacterium]